MSGCFAPDWPQQCSGRPVARYSAPELAGQLESGWVLINQACEETLTSAGVIQPFTWSALRSGRGAPQLLSAVWTVRRLSHQNSSASGTARPPRP